MKIIVFFIFALVLLIVVGSLVNNFVSTPETQGYSEYQGAIQNGQISAQQTRPIIVDLIFSWWWPALYYGVAIIFGVFVYKDAKQQPNLAFNIWPFWWGVVIVFHPVLGVLSYWVIHHSSLSKREFDA